jgi:hypothetical protein
MTLKIEVYQARDGKPPTKRGAIPLRPFLWFPPLPKAALTRFCFPTMVNICSNVGKLQVLYFGIRLMPVAACMNYNNNFVVQASNLFVLGCANSR